MRGIVEKNQFTERSRAKYFEYDVTVRRVNIQNGRCSNAYKQLRLLREYVLIGTIPKKKYFENLQNSNPCPLRDAFYY